MRTRNARTPKPKTLTETASETLKRLSVDVTASDKHLIEKKDIASVSTQNRYLAGEVPNTELATTLITFYQKRINSRLKKIANV